MKLNMVNLVVKVITHMFFFYCNNARICIGVDAGNERNSERANKTETWFMIFILLASNLNSVLSANNQLR